MFSQELHDSDIARGMLTNDMEYPKELIDKLIDMIIIPLDAGMVLVGKRKVRAVMHMYYI